MPDYRVEVRFDRARQKHRATSAEIPGLDESDMNVERLFAKVMKAAPDLLREAGKPSSNFNLKFEKAGE
mgnify:CR=1 FL=1